MVANVTVNIVGGAQAQNTTAVTLGLARWGLNGAANFGAPLPVASGLQTLTVYKTTAPTQISITVEVRDWDSTLNITVQNDSIAVTVI
ncbi:hypothetical protein JFV28_14795 [Pseudomonas sp. TH05]|uniref:hypothetical protein n=1 Tax=unclassified Pseudomonas TaxID=196821 RepID=UPI0009966F92|nr:MULTISPECIES: hypothetical protein [unclassified Pseudomonas]MBK5540717.1 hypothetical protein [Pseudomonas sp. TH07]MBK5557129.1 hypothetical protein [Pseudomonas sp. TH05]OOV94728.1 hypothetical protein MF4836_18310 [Pseudomonas sp. MF4836]